MKLIIDGATGIVIGTATGMMGSATGQRIIDVAEFDADLIGKATAIEAGGVWTIIPIVPPEPGPEQLKAALIAYAENKRWRVETGGILVGGRAISTDRDSQALIAGAKALADEEPEELVDFKAASGWVQIDAVAVRAIALAVGRHVRACFRIERLVWDAIDAGTLTSTEEVDAAEWPANT